MLKIYEALNTFNLYLGAEYQRSKGSDRINEVILVSVIKKSFLLCYSPLCYVSFYAIFSGLNHFSPEELKTSMSDRGETRDVKFWRAVIH